jgi:hypothetical protein
MVLLDEYDRKARLIPGLLVTFPVAITIIALSLKAQPVVAAACGLISGLGGPFVLASAVRTRGLAMQETLFRTWNGAPTTHALRHRDQMWSDARRAQWRLDVGKATGLALPDEATEAADPMAADGAFETAVARMRTMTRDKGKFRMVFIENRNFGYERNLLAMQRPGLLICAVSAAALIVLLIVRLLGDLLGVSALSLGVGLGIVAATAIFWVAIPSRDRALLVGRRYAEQLLDQAAQFP